jgi:hypothetical protein
MATNDTTRRARAARRAARRASRAGSRRATSRAPRTTSPTSPATPIAQAQQLAERALRIPVSAVLEARDRVAGTVGGLIPAQARQALRLDAITVTSLQRGVEPLRSRVEDVVQNSVSAGMRLLGDAQGRLARR